MSDIRRLFYSTACKSETHLRVKDECVNQLEIKGAFRKEKVLEKTRLLDVGSAIHWGHIVRMIETDHKMPLMALGQKYFNRHSLGDKITNSYLAGGPGGKTVGYASVSDINGELVRVYLKRKTTWENGVTDHVNKQFGAAIQAKVIEIPKRKRERVRLEYQPNEKGEK